jgi:hypothetical protein
MSFIKMEQLKICNNRIRDLLEEKSIIFENLKSSADPNSPGDYLDADGLKQYRDVNAKIHAILQEIKALQGIDDNDIIE